MADNEQQDDYLSNMLNALNEKEQESQSYNDPETIARQAKEKLEAENAVKEANEPEREADADAKLEALLDNTPLEEAAEAKLTSDDNSELSDDDMKRLMNMNLDDIIDDGVNGYVIPFNKQNEYICKLRYLMSLDDTSLCYMRNNAIKKSELYDINKVVFEWEKLFNELI